MMHKRMLIKRFVLVTVLIQMLCAWTVAPLPKDVTSTIDGLVSCSSDVPTDELDPSVFLKEDAPKKCHRWGLKWGFYQPDDAIISPAQVQNMPFPERISEEDVGQDVDWQLLLAAIDKNNNGNPRLPTIKELVRIFDYDTSTKSSAGVPKADQVFRSWLQETNGTSDVLIGYLVSSTYRHINGTSNFNGEMDGAYKRPRILGVHIGTGKVVSFNGHLELCESLDINAECITPAAAVNVYAFTVADI